VIAVSRREDRLRSRVLPPEDRRDFLDAWDADTVEEALATAERAGTTEDLDDRRRCPACASTSIRLKTAVSRRSNQRDGGFKCMACPTPTHFSTPLPPRSAFDVDEPVCPECGSERLRRPRDVDGVRCLACGATSPTAQRGEFYHGTPIMPRTLRSPTETYRLPTPDELRAVREALDLTTSDYGGAPVGRAAVRNWERGETAPRVDHLASVLAWYRAIDGVRRAQRLAAVVPEGLRGEGEGVRP